jgi:hypothetical protein
VIGEIMVKVKYNEQDAHLPIVIIDGPGHPLLGCNWLKVILLNWKSIYQVSVKSTDNDFHDLLQSYSDLFDGSLGKVCLDLNPNVKPIFFKAQNVPFAI